MENIKSVIKEGIVKLELGAELDKVAQKLSGEIELDIDNQNLFIDLIHSVFDEGHKKVIVDMSYISYVDSSGLWALFEGHKKAHQQNGQMVLFQTRPDVKRILDITKISSKMDICDTEEDALAALSA